LELAVAYNIYNNNHHRLLASCSCKAGLDNDTYIYTYYNNSHTIEDARTVIYADQVVQLS